MSPSQAPVVRAIFGAPPPRTPEGADRAAAELDRCLRPGEIALITGPSGGGKSTILRALAARLSARGEEVITACPRAARRRRRPVVDLFRGPLEARLGLLARAGLADAALFTLHPRDLSDGQAARLALALGLARAGRGPAMLIGDEFASTLDRPAALALARTIRRALRPPARLVLATSHDDILEPLAPAILVHQPLAAPASIMERPR